MSTSARPHRKHDAPEPGNAALPVTDEGIILTGLGGYRVAETDGGVFADRRILFSFDPEALKDVEANRDKVFVCRTLGSGLNAVLKNNGGNLASVIHDNDEEIAKKLRKTTLVRRGNALISGGEVGMTLIGSTFEPAFSYGLYEKPGGGYDVFLCPGMAPAKRPVSPDCVAIASTPTMAEAERAAQADVCSHAKDFFRSRMSRVDDPTQSRIADGASALKPTKLLSRAVMMATMGPVEGNKFLGEAMEPIGDMPISGYLDKAGLLEHQDRFTAGPGSAPQRDTLPVQVGQIIRADGSITRPDGTWVQLPRDLTEMAARLQVADLASNNRLVDKEKFALLQSFGAAAAPKNGEAGPHNGPSFALSVSSPGGAAAVSAVGSVMAAVHKSEANGILTEFDSSLRRDYGLDYDSARAYTQCVYDTGHAFASMTTDELAKGYRRGTLPYGEIRLTDRPGWTASHKDGLLSESLKVTSPDGKCLSLTDGTGRTIIPAVTDLRAGTAMNITLLETGDQDKEQTTYEAAVMAAAASRPEPEQTRNLRR